MVRHSKPKKKQSQKVQAFMISSLFLIPIVLFKTKWQPLVGLVQVRGSSTLVRLQNKVENTGNTLEKTEVFLGLF